MSTKKERMYARIKEHGNNLLKIFPAASERDPVTLSKKAFALERKAHAIEEEACNGNPNARTEEQYNAWQASIEHREELIHKAFERLFGVPLAYPYFINGDPRGYALKIKSEAAANMNIPRDWGGYGIIAPDLTED